jgi:hypothetical protein
MMHLLTQEQHAQLVELIENLGRFSPRPASIWKHYYPSAQGDFVDLREYREKAAPLVVMLKAMQPVSPVAYRFTENRGNGNTEFSYYGLDEVGLAYRDNCLEIAFLYTPTNNAGGKPLEKSD